MKFSQLVIQCHSVRKYKSSPVEKHKLEQVLNAARMAPSALNFQLWHFIVVSQPAKLELLHNAYKRDWFFRYFSSRFIPSSIFSMELA
jgi:nitroreductase